MKNLRSFFVASLITLGAFSAVTYTACTKDNCKGVVCNNGGTCSGGTCVCPAGYSGSDCSTVAVFGTWKGSDVCTSGTYSNITITNSPSSTSATTVLIANLGGFGGTVVITGTLNGSTVTFTNQSVGGNRVVSGTITLTSATTFTVQYTVAPQVGASDNCSGSYTKQ